MDRKLTKPKHSLKRDCLVKLRGSFLYVHQNASSNGSPKAALNISLTYVNIKAPLAQKSFLRKSGHGMFCVAKIPFWSLNLWSPPLMILPATFLLLLKPRISKYKVLLKTFLSLKTRTVRRWNLPIMCSQASQSRSPPFCLKIWRHKQVQCIGF